MFVISPLVAFLLLVECCICFVTWHQRANPKRKWEKKRKAWKLRKSNFTFYWCTRLGISIMNLTWRYEKVGYVFQLPGDAVYNRDSLYYIGLCKARPEAVSQAKPGPNRPSQAGPFWRLHGGFGLACVLEKPKPSRQAAAFQWHITHEYMHEYLLYFQFLFIYFTTN